MNDENGPSEEQIEDEMRRFYKQSGRTDFPSDREFDELRREAVERLNS